MTNSPATAAPAAQDLGHLYIGLHGRVRKRVDDAMVAGGVSLSRTMVLKLLADRGPVNQSAIAAEFGYAPRSITDLVDGLEHDGLAERVENPDDRRSRLVRITESGSLALQRSLAIKYQAFEEIFAVLDPAARTQLFALLETVRTSLSAKPGESHVC
jgi:DNA-binding MarR family transcriptional regulator